MGKTAWKVGELARCTGLSVRTLHHYDDIGLLSPDRRTESGHRLYGPDEIRRLQQITSLRQLGFSLDEIRGCLDGPEWSPLHVVEQHIARLREAIETQTHLQARLERIAGRLRAEQSVSTDELIGAIEEATKMEKFYTPEQSAKLAERAKTVGPERMQQVQQDWAEVFAGFRAEMQRGTDPSAEPALALVRRADALIREFTGGDTGIERSLGRMVAADPGAMRQRWGIEAEVAEYMGRARAALLGED